MKDAMLEVSRAKRAYEKGILSLSDLCETLKKVAYKFKDSMESLGGVIEFLDDLFTKTKNHVCVAAGDWIIDTLIAPEDDKQ